MKAVSNIVFVAIGLVLVLTPAAVASQGTYPIAWTAQIGTPVDDRSFSVAVDGSDNVYITGDTFGSLNGSNAGNWDAFLVKYDSSGNELWSRQIGTSANDFSRSVTVGASGNVYITGATSGDLGGNNAGGLDAFLTKFDSSGNELWTQQIGSPNTDISSSVAVDGSGNVYITGFGGHLDGTSGAGYDIFLVKYDSSGNLLWSKENNSNLSDYSQSVAIDGTGNAYITGYTKGDLAGDNAGDDDAVLFKYDSLGNELWSKQIGTSGEDQAHAVAVDTSGNVYISGHSNGDLGGTNTSNNYDAFLFKYDSSGNLIWSRLTGSSSSEFSRSVAIDASGNVYISGQTFGSLGGTNAGQYDAFLIKFDSSGNELWSQQIGTPRPDESRSVAVDILGNAYISGWTEDSLGGPNAGGQDAFLVKYAAPEPNGQIRGTVWDDIDGNGQRDAGEPGLAGWTVYLDIDQDGLLDTSEPAVITSADGTYTFSGLTAGTYDVREVLPPGWQMTYPRGASIDMPTAAVASINDSPIDGLGDSFNTTDSLLRQIDPDRGTPSKEDRAIVEVDVSSLAGADLASATLNFTLAINNHGGDEREFHVLAYPGNGTAELGDFSRPGILIGDVVLTTTGTAYAMDVRSAIELLLAGGADSIGFRFDPIGGYVFPCLVRDVSLAVSTVETSHTVVLGDNTSTVVLDFEELSGPGELDSYERDGMHITTTAPMSNKFRLYSPGDNKWAGSRGLSSVWTPVDVILTQTDGTAFTLSSIDLANPFPAIPTWSSLTLVGTRADGTEVTETLSGWEGNFQTFPLTQMTDVVSVHYRDTGAFEQFDQIDNLVIVRGAPAVVDGIDFGNITTANEVVGRHIVYHESSWNDYFPRASDRDLGAIAPDKTALLPGQTASFANYTSFTQGINLILVEFDAAADADVSPNDFTFKVGNDSNPAGWAVAPDPWYAIDLTIYTPTGPRYFVAIRWQNELIRNQWLQVTVKATARTGLAEPDVFYFGNAIGETGNSSFEAKVSPADAIVVRNNPHSATVNPAGIDDNCDFNRDKKVGPTDSIICRNNGTNSSTALQLITVP